MYTTLNLINMFELPLEELRGVLQKHGVLSADNAITPAGSEFVILNVMDGNLYWRANILTLLEDR